MYNPDNLKYISQEDLYFSLMRGSGVYCWNNLTDRDPADVSGKTFCPVFMDVKTGQEFLVKRIYREKYMRQYKNGIQNPPKADHVIWPVDIVSLHGHRISVNYAEHVFGLHTDEKKGEEGDYVLLFPYRDYSISRTVRDELSEVKQVSWKDTRVRGLLTKITEAFQKLNESGYLCLDFDFSHLYIRDDRSILFSYSNLLIPVSQGETDAANRPEILSRGEYPYEFAEPALVQGKIKYADPDMQNYSLTAMLFYLMIGRLPCDGPLLLGFTDNNEVEHERRFEVYHKNPVFIFDPEDSSNHLGEFAADQRTIDLWEELPEEIRNLFIRTLSRKNAERRQEVSNPSPAEWLKCLALL